MEPFLTQLVTAIDGVSSDLLNEVTVNEVNLTESLSTPGLQTSVILQSTTNTERQGGGKGPVKNLDEYYGKTFSLYAERPILKDIFGENFKYNFSTKQTIFRLSNRGPINYELEQFQLDACDPSLLVDGKTYLSRSWRNVTPDTVVRDVFSSVFPTSNLEVEAVNPRRDYIAEYVHPFQAINQQSELSLVKTNVLDPSLVHFMTYQNLNHDDIPTHNFRSLTRMALADPIFTFSYNGKVTTADNFGNPYDIMTYMFPRDFDLLADLMNGVDYNTGQSFVQMNQLNPLTNRVSSFGPKIGNALGATPFMETTNLGTEDIQNSAGLASERIRLLRRARMSLIEQDSIGIRFTVPFSPFLNAGRTVKVNFFNTKDGSLNYGSGKYLIVNMTHNIKLGGFGTTTVDCVADSVSRGQS